MISYCEDTCDYTHFVEPYMLHPPNRFDEPNLIERQHELNPSYTEIFYKIYNKIRHGEYLLFYPNGSLMYKCNYVLGKRHGQSLEFYPDNKKKIECIYKHGVLEGPFKYYYPNGVMAYEIPYIHGLPVGECSCWNIDGILLKIVTY